MISLLDDMDNNNPKYENLDHKFVIKEMNIAKNKFFKLLSKHFYSLWD
jgi:hypothetical protein